MPSLRPPHPVAVLATALLVAVCVWLGYWQLDRAREKQALIDGFRRGDATSVDITSRSLDGLARYQTVNARGAYEPRRQILIDNMPATDGRPGYRVLTPFRRTTGGALVLVDRGWVPLGDSREHRPAVDVPDDTREIAGRIDRPPEPGLRMRDAVAADPEVWPRVLNYPTTEQLAAALGEPIELQIVLLHPQAPDGYERKWQPALRMNPSRHLAYAIQWFAFAFVAVVVLAIASMRRGSRKDGGTP
jgi:surfeit locus 1 family protein